MSVVQDNHPFRKKSLSKRHLCYYSKSQTKHGQVNESICVGLSSQRAFKAHEQFRPTFANLMNDLGRSTKSRGSGAKSTRMISLQYHSNIFRGYSLSHLLGVIRTVKTQICVFYFDDYTTISKFLTNEFMKNPLTGFTI